VNLTSDFEIGRKTVTNKQICGSALGMKQKCQEVLSIGALAVCFDRLSCVTEMLPYFPPTSLSISQTVTCDPHH